MITTIKNLYDKSNKLRAKLEIIGDKVWVEWFEIGQVSPIEDLDLFENYNHQSLYVRLQEYCEDNGLILWSY